MLSRMFAARCANDNTALDSQWDLVKPLPAVLAPQIYNQKGCLVFAGVGATIVFHAATKLFIRTSSSPTREFNKQPF